MTFYPKVGVLKKRVLNSEGNYRYYSPNYNPEHGKKKKGIRPRMPIIDLNIHQNISTEKQFLGLVYDNWGDGEYLMFGFVRGRRGLWTFWKGSINKDGFLFRKQNDSNDSGWKKRDWEYEKLQDDMQKSGDLDNDVGIKKKKYGFFPYLKSSGRRGTFVSWSNNGMNPYKEIESEKWSDVDSKQDEQPNWDMDKVKKKEFEKW